MRIGRWNIAKRNERAITELVAAGYSPLVSGVLSAKGLTTPEAAREFLTDDVDALFNPFLIKDMDKAVKRVRRACEQHEKVAVYGDYDVDGITATCLMFEYFIRKGVEVVAHIPNRMDEGYGVNERALSELAAQGVTLIVTVDCGITAAKEIEFAKQLGVDVVITDHHECAGQIPAAVAVVDPKRPGDQYPFPYLAGVGVAFKLVCALEGGAGNEDTILHFCGDLVAMGTLADVMPVVNENRIFIHKGIEAMHTARREGLEALAAEVGEDIKTIGSDKISFTIAPRLNAAGRMGQAQRAFQLLSSKGAERSAELAKELCELNRDRQALEGEMLADALSMLSDYEDGDPIVLGSGSWHQGVAGIVASRLSERYCVPAVIVCFDGGEGRGSCRSFNGFDIFSALDDLKGYLDGFGGHTLAAGLTMREEDFPAFAEAFKQYYRDNTGESITPVVEIDLEIDYPELLSLKNVEDLKMLEPWGNGNSQPLFCIRGAKIEQVTPISNGKHLKFRTSKEGTVFDCVFFSKSLYDFALRANEIADLAFFPQVNEYRGVRSVQLLMRDVRPSPESIDRRTMEMALVRHFDDNLTRDEKRLLLPERRDFVDVWHALENLSDKVAHIGGETRMMLFGITSMVPFTAMPKVYSSLRVFSEMGLISMEEKEGYSAIVLHRGNRRIDLNGSKILKRLRS